jgi:hypothetical protein
VRLFAIANAALLTDERCGAWHCRRLVLVCPHCAADCLVALTFPVYQRDAGPEVIFRRPMARCARCNRFVVANVIARQRMPKSI